MSCGDFIATKLRGFSDLFIHSIAGQQCDKNVKHELATELIKRLWGAFEIITTTSTSCNSAPSDPDDLVFMLCAIDGKADILVSNDKDLLELRFHYNSPEILERKDALAVLQT